ncbi:MAG TPA: YtxH domain-containing protein, partial [Thermoleophilia bacterium]|nr:YtxH domain-containing protein [Thermoleophilia bacterium]
MRFIKFLLGVLVGATAVSLVTPKTGRQMREQLLSGVGSRMLPAAPEYPEPSGERDWGTSATAVAEPPVAEAAPVEEAPAEEAP